MAQHPAISSGNVAVITGGADGIGLAAARRYQSLGLSVEILNDESEEVEFGEDYMEQIPSLGINLSGREKEDAARA